MSNSDEQEPLVTGPRLTPAEMDAKVSQMREGLSNKLNKWANRLVVSMASTKKIVRMEGEEWTEDGKKWVMSNGIKTSVSTLQGARMPWWCPKCSVAMNHRFDRKFYFLRGWCYNCNCAFEHDLRVEGKWEEFERRRIRENEKSFLLDKIQEHTEYMRTFRPMQAHFEDGRWENIAEISDFEPLFKELEKDIEFCMLRLEAVVREEEMTNESVG
jgi:hypothetical protein